MGAKTEDWKCTPKCPFYNYRLLGVKEVKTRCAYGNMYSLVWPGMECDIPVEAMKEDAAVLVKVINARRREG